MHEALKQKNSAYCRDTLWNISLAQIVLWLLVTISVCKSSSPPNPPPILPSFSITRDSAFNIHWDLCLRWIHLKTCSPPPPQKKSMKNVC